MTALGRYMLSTAQIVQLVAGGFLLALGIAGIAISYLASFRIRKPAAELAKRVIVSFFFFGIMGGASEILTVLWDPNMWVLIAVSVTLGYLVMAFAALRYLRILSGIGGGGKKTQTTVKEKLPLPQTFMVSTPEEAKYLLGTLKEHYEKAILAIGRDHPRVWKEKYGVKPDRYIWLTRIEHPSAVSPSSLHVVNGEIVRFLHSNPGGIVYFEGIEVVLLYLDFNSLAKFLLGVKDMVLVENAYFIVLASPETLNERQYSMLLREFKRPNVEELLERLAGVTLFGAVPPTKGPKDKPMNDTGGEEDAGGKGSKERG